MNRLQGMVAFITGAGAGIGRATALRYAAEGAQVILAELDPDRGEGTFAEIQANNPDAALVVTTDVTEEASVEAALQQACSRVQNDSATSTF